jgi:hypothetical protein
MNGDRLITMLALLLALAAPPVIGVAAASRGGAGEGVLWVLPAPWIAADALLVRAEAREVGPVRPRLGLHVAGDGDLALRLRESGALLVLAEDRLAGLCGGWR